MRSLSRAVFTLAAASVGVVSLQAEEPTGVPGENFSLHGALELFQKAASPETFEKALNDPANKVNNLDLNGDGEVDYVRVVAKKDGDAHVLVLQVPVSETENQDVAVIGLEKTGADKAVLQIIGDEDVFGEETVVEPGEGDDEEDADEAAKHAMPLRAFKVVVNVWPWPCVRFMYAPAYVPWVSPWRWRAYPVWWRPWRPLAWAVWHPFRVRPGFAVVRTHRVVVAHRVYRPHRVASVTVRTRHSAAVGKYRVTRTTTVHRGPKGGKVRTTRTTVRRRR
jgi:hypothetical protein